MKRTIGSKILTMLSCTVLAAVIFIATPAYCMAYTQATGIVSADAAKVRKEPNTASEAVVGLLKGSTVTVTDEVTDSAGVMWYKVSVDNSTGYIRSDLLIKAATSAGTAGNTTTPQGTGTEKKPEPTAAVAIAETKAYVNYESARVREGASTNHEIVGSAVENTPVTITGEANGSDGKKWYQIKYNNQAGREVIGFIRSDLLTIGDPPAAAAAEEAPAEPETPAENEETAGEEGGITEGEAETEEGTVEVPEDTPDEVVPEASEKPDYEMVFTANNEGVEEWYLYDNIDGTRQKLAGLLAAAEAGAVQSEADVKQISTQKIIIIALAVAAALLAITVTLLLFKIKDLKDEDYDDDEDDDDDDDDDGDEAYGDDGREEDEEEEVVRAVHKKRTAGGSKGSGRITPVKTSQEGTGRSQVRETAAVKRVEYDPAEAQFEAGASAAPRQQPKRKAKNFLADDEFEFEFLNMDDKK